MFWKKDVYPQNNIPANSTQVSPIDCVNLDRVEKQITPTIYQLHQQATWTGYTPEGQKDKDDNCLPVCAATPHGLALPVKNSVE